MPGEGVDDLVCVDVVVDVDMLAEADRCGFADVLFGEGYASPSWLLDEESIFGEGAWASA